MKLEIKSEKENPFLKRKELLVEVAHESEATPSHAALHPLLSKHLDEDAEKVEIRSIRSSNGMPMSVARVFVWKEKQAKAEPEKPERNVAKGDSSSPSAASPKAAETESPRKSVADAGE